MSEEKNSGVSIVFCTVPDTPTAQKIADRLLTEKAAACVSILPLLESHYVWEGKREVAREFMLLIKLKSENYPLVEAVICGLHPYLCPEILEYPISRGYPPYLSWILEKPVAENP